jgi:hypothetical protein
LVSAVAAHSESAEPMPGSDAVTEQSPASTAPLESATTGAATPPWASDTANPNAADQASSMASDSGLRCDPGPGFERCEQQTAAQMKQASPQSGRSPL